VTASENDNIDDQQYGFQPVTLTVPECVSDEDDHSDGMTPFSNIPSV
jgi:hypothetical protein